MEVVEAELAEVVGRMGGGKALCEWRVEPLAAPVPSASVGLWRVTDAGGPVPAWSAILKVIALREGNARWQCGADEGHWYYWRREATVYESGLLEQLPGHLRAPTCHLVAERPDGSVALWLEDLATVVSGDDRHREPGGNWSMERYEWAARDLAVAQGAFVVDRVLPEASWLSRGWLASYLDLRNTADALLDDPAAWRHPSVAPHVDAGMAEGLRRLRADRVRFLAALASLPETVCQLDLHPANLFAVGDDTVVIDWAFVGIGALGEDAGNLVPDAVLDFHVAPGGIDALFEAVVRGYAAGLEAAGWRGGPEDVRFAVGLGAVAKYSWLAPFVLDAATSGREQLNGRPVAEAMEWWAPTLEFLLRTAEDVRRVLERSG